MHVPFLILFAIALVFLSFFSGAFLTYHQHFPYNFIYQINAGANAWQEENVLNANNTNKKTKKKRPSLALGKWKVITNKPNKSTNGYTLVCSKIKPHALLLDENGKKMHTWSHIAHPKNRPGKVFYEDAYLYPNGDLLAVHYPLIDKKSEGRLIKLDKNSKIIWQHTLRAHHEVTADEDGNVFVLTRAIDHTKPKRQSHFNTPFLHDYIVIISPDGEKKKRISLVNAFIDTPYEKMLEGINNKQNRGDYLHSNDVEPLPSHLASQFPQFKPGYLLVSMRNIHTIAVVDPSSEKIVWAVQGDWKMQHDPDFLPNGNILLYDNKGNKDGNKSRILEINPNNSKVVHFYDHTKRLAFYSRRRGRQEQLDNGNILLNSSGENRLIEWSKKDGIVWELQNKKFKEITCTQHFNKGELTFLSKK